MKHSGFVTEKVILHHTNFNPTQPAYFLEHCLSECFPFVTVLSSYINKFMCNTIFLPVSLRRKVQHGPRVIRVLEFLFARGMGSC
jgi:hypothetical protein